MQDVIELRKSKWTLRQGQAPSGPATIAQIHEEGPAKAKEREEKEGHEAYPIVLAVTPCHAPALIVERRCSVKVAHLVLGPDGWSTVGGNASPTGPWLARLAIWANFGKIET